MLIRDSHLISFVRFEKGKNDSLFTNFLRKQERHKSILKRPFLLHRTARRFF